MEKSLAILERYEPWGKSAKEIIKPTIYTDCAFILKLKCSNHDLYVCCIDALYCRKDNGGQTLKITKTSILGVTTIGGQNCDTSPSHATNELSDEPQRDSGPFMLKCPFKVTYVIDVMVFSHLTT